MRSGEQQGDRRHRWSVALLLVPAIYLVAAAIHTGPLTPLTLRVEPLTERLLVPEFYLPGVSDTLFGLGELLVVGAYGVTNLLVFFPVLVAMPRIRLWAVAAMALFNLSTAVLMGLTSFAVVMICFDLLFVDPHLKRLDWRSAQHPDELAAVAP